MLGPYLALGHKDEQGSSKGKNQGRRQGVGSKKVPEKKKISEYKNENKILKRAGQHICTLQFSVVITDDKSHQIQERPKGVNSI